MFANKIKNLDVSVEAENNLKYYIIIYKVLEGSSAANYVMAIKITYLTLCTAGKFFSKAAFGPNFADFRSKTFTKEAIFLQDCVLLRYVVKNYCYCDIFNIIFSADPKNKIFLAALFSSY